MDFSSISEREKDVIFHLVKGLSNDEIADKLYISHKTVKFHLSHIFKKLNVKSRLQCVILCLREANKRPHLPWGKDNGSDTTKSRN